MMITRMMLWENRLKVRRVRSSLSYDRVLLKAKSKNRNKREKTQGSQEVSKSFALENSEERLLSSSWLFLLKAEKEETSSTTEKEAKTQN
jgi:hypothetical protein